MPYAQLILEEAALSGVDEALIDEIFAVLVRDFNAYAVELTTSPRRRTNRPASRCG